MNGDPSSRDLTEPEEQRVKQRSNSGQTCASQAASRAAMSATLARRLLVMASNWSICSRSRSCTRSAASALAWSTKGQRVGDAVPWPVGGSSARDATDAFTGQTAVK